MPRRAFALAPLFLALAAAKPVDPEVDALSRAMTALQKHRLPEALAAIEEPAAPTDVLGDYRAWIRARILLALKRPAEAREALAAIPLCKPPCKHPLALDVAELTARTFEAAAPLTAARLYAELAPDGRLYSKAIELYRSREDEKHARQMEERLLVDAAHSPEAHQLAASLGAEGLADRIPLLERRRTRVFVLLDAHDNEDARAEADRAIAELPKNHPLLCELLYASGKASRKLKDFAKAVETLSRAGRECGRLQDEPAPPSKLKTSTTTWALAHAAAEDLRLRSALLETEVRAIRRDVRGARVLASWLADHDRLKTLADDGLLLLGMLLEREGQGEESKKVYQRIADEYPAGDVAAEARWKLGFGAIEAADYPRALAILGETRGTAAENARAKYWIARLSEGTEPACKRYQEAATDPALTLYAWLALHRAERVLPDCAVKLRAELLALLGSATATATTAAPALAYEKELPFRRAKKLVEVPGFKVYASLEIGRLRRETPSLEDMIALAFAYDAIGDHRRAQLALRSKIVTTTLAQLPRGRTLEIWRAAYSRPFEEDVERAAKEQKIDPLLLYALAREESTFDPEVISWAGAIGLAQLMPRTAESVHARLGLGRLNPAKLTDPALNLRLGARVLRDSLKQFSSSVPLALAAYNGGPGAVVKNLPPKAGDFDLWIETIPVEETRKYVKRVLQTYGIYHFLYDRAQPVIELPETIPAGKLAHALRR